MQDKILRAHIESYKGIVDTEIDFQDKNIVAIIGDGGLGKTSIIEFFKTIVTATIPDHHIHIGRGRAKGGVDLLIDGEEYKVKFTKTKNSETVTVTSSKTNMKGGKDVLRQLVGAVAIDPFYLQALDLQDQIKEFKKLMRLDTKDLDKAISDAESEREIIGREVRKLDGSIKDDPNNRIDFEQHQEKYAQEKQLGDKPDKLKEAITHNLSQTRVVAFVEQTEKAIDNNWRRVEDIEDQIKRLRIEQDQLKEIIEMDKKEVGVKRGWLAENPIIDINVLQNEIDEINEFNRERMSLQAFFAKKNDHAVKSKEYSDQKALVKKLIADKAEYVKQNMIAVPGFEFLEPRKDEQGKVIDDREGPYYNGIPLSALSTTELITFAIELKKALSGLPVVIVDDYESVGSKGQAALAEMCKAGKCQAIVSVMDRKVKDLKIVIQNDLDFTDAEIQAATDGKEEFVHFVVERGDNEQVSKDSMKEFEQQSQSDEPE